MASFHHGNLRAELLDRAEAALRDRGLDHLSLRELAREAGVSHGAPRSHFVDRTALLEALAERGYDRLAESIGTAADAASSGGGDGAALLRAAGGAYLDFAADNPALLNLMITAKADSASGTVHEAAQRFFAVTSRIVRTALGQRLADDERAGLWTLTLSAAIQGISSFVSTNRVPVETGDALLDETVRLFLAGLSGDAA